MSTTPKGKLLIIGGAEDRGEDNNDRPFVNNLKRLEILRELITAGKKIEIITTGSRFQDEVKKEYQKAFHKINFPNPGFLPIKDKIEAHDEKFLKRVEAADAIFFTGGDQFRLASILGGTPISDMIKNKYQHKKNFLVAGTSAGAMVMSENMITRGGEMEALVETDLRTSQGLGLLENCIIDTHFIKRGRFGRLAYAVIINPELLGVGLCEDTALIIKNGSEAECRGSGMVVLIDGKHIQQTNIAHVKKNHSVYVENLIVHILSRGCRFSLESRKLYSPSKKNTETLKEIKHEKNRNRRSRRRRSR